MKSSITLASFHPRLFNVIGDQGNLEVIEAELRWSGRAASLIELDPNNAVTADFVLIGSASIEVMRELEAELAALTPGLLARAMAGLPTLFCGSGYERFAAEIFGLEATALPRTSDYYRGNFEGYPLQGYLNTESGIPVFSRSNNQFGSLLSGPLLAKNRWLLIEFAKQLGFDLSTPASVIELQRLASS